jgi:uncharacterized membrane protein
MHRVLFRGAVAVLWLGLTASCHSSSGMPAARAGAAGKGTHVLDAASSVRDAAADVPDAASSVLDAAPDAAADVPDAAADAAVASCSAGPASGDFPCDVGAVIKARCQPCHQRPPVNGAHFPLLSYEDTRQPFGPGTLRFQRMQQVIEPDFLPHMPPHGAQQPTVQELETLRAWFRSCAPPAAEGLGCDTQEP